MAHRKIVEVTLKVVVDVNNSNTEEPMNSDSYTRELNDLIEEFFFDTECNLTSNEAGDVRSVEIVGYRVKL